MRVFLPREMIEHVEGHHRTEGAGREIKLRRIGMKHSGARDVYPRKVDLRLGDVDAHALMQANDLAKRRNAIAAAKVENGGTRPEACKQIAQQPKAGPLLSGFLKRRVLSRHLVIASGHEFLSLVHSEQTSPPPPSRKPVPPSIGFHHVAAAPKLRFVEGERAAIVQYDPEWPLRFQAERRLLERVLAPWLVEGGIHHVGSTAIPGIAAKPIIDIVAGVRDLKEARAAFRPLGEQSYLHDPHRPSISHHFAKPSKRLSEMTHGLHLTEPGSDLWLERLAFRDALRGDPDLAAEYETLKIRLADEHRDDGRAYTSGKRAFVARVLASAGLQPGRR